VRRQENNTLKLHFTKMPKGSLKSQQAKHQRASRGPGFGAGYIEDDPMELQLDPDFEPGLEGDKSDKEDYDNFAFSLLDESEGSESEDLEMGYPESEAPLEEVKAHKLFKMKFRNTEDNWSIRSTILGKSWQSSCLGFVENLKLILRKK
jgi:hypothetical protein